MIQPKERERTYQEPPSSHGERTQPGHLEVFLHLIKTFKLLKALLTDTRVSLIRKLFFLGGIAALLVLLFFPDLLSETVLTAILPLVGSLLGVPLDAGIDWVGFALLVVSLLHVFPADLVAEHYARIFHA